MFVCIRQSRTRKPLIIGEFKNGRKEAVERGVEARADFRFVDLRGLDLSGIDFSGQNLNCADFRGSKLHGCNFSGALLRGALFRGADLTNATFFRADAFCADMRHAILKGVSFKEARTDCMDTEVPSFPSRPFFIRQPALG